MGVAAILREALIFPLRRMGPVAVVLFGSLQGGFEYLGHHEPASTGIFAALVLIMLCGLIFFDVRAATLTTLGGNHLFARPAGPWGKALLATVLTLIIFFALALSLTAALVLLASDGAFFPHLVNVMGIPMSCISAYAVAAVIAENDLRGMLPSRVWRVIKGQPGLCLTFAGLSALATLLAITSDIGGAAAILTPIFNTYLWAVCGRLIGRMAIGYRAALPALP